MSYKILWATEEVEFGSTLPKTWKTIVRVCFRNRAAGLFDLLSTSCLALTRCGEAAQI